MVIGGHDSSPQEVGYSKKSSNSTEFMVLPLLFGFQEHRIELIMILGSGEFLIIVEAWPTLFVSVFIIVPSYLS